jgi:ABC-type lipoprotein release transport system permease subunit
VYGIVAVVLLASAVLASAIPAVRASRVDPNVALRAE